VYPALAVLEALGHDAQPVLWVGSQGGMEAGLVQRAGVPFTAIPAAGVHGVGWRAMPRNLSLLAKGVLASRRILRDFKPEVVFFTGGFVAAPMAVAARGVSSLLYVPDIEPGLALKFLARFASHIAVTAEDSRRYFNRPASLVTVTGYPVRADLNTWTPETARAHFHLDDQSPVLLVFGGSKGARSINQAVLACLPQLLGIAQVIHITGQLDWDEVETAQSRLAQELQNRYHAFPYLHEDMGAALASANLSISRAGASSLGELPLFGIPAILVPYPYAWRYQKVNAGYLVKHGAAVTLEDAALQDQLFPTVQALLGQPARLQSMACAMRAQAHPQAAGQIASLLKALATPGGETW
jgi:UDP-N-acetylglucosamine--N-acetylmuramyl-(pentapeptide) pyrophosphoryl-undecaprenol N-acetylglucosamine transferase